MLPLLLFLHVLAVCGLAGGLTLEIAALIRLHMSATYADARTALFNEGAIGKLMGPSALLLIATGVGMVYTGGIGWAPWNVVPLIIALLLSVTGPAINGRRMHAIQAACAENDGRFNAALLSSLRDPVLNYSAFFAVFGVIAMLFIMVTKPELPICATAVALALVAAGAAAAVRLNASKQAANARA